MSSNKIEISVKDIPKIIKTLEEAEKEIEFERKSKNLFIDDLYKVCEISLKQDKEIERLNNIIKTKDEGIKAFTEDLCEESTKIEKATEYIKKHTYHATPKKLQNGIYERGILFIKSDFDIEELLEILDKTN